jgi:hypothetical protein
MFQQCLIKDCGSTTKQALRSNFSNHGQALAHPQQMRAAEISRVGLLVNGGGAVILTPTRR